MVQKNKSREYTEDEVRDSFLNYVSQSVQYWENESRAPDSLSKLEGLAHSILVAVDGEAGNLPRFILAPDPHPDDKEDSKSCGTNYYPENHNSSIKCNISGCLHELWPDYRHGRL